MATNLVFFDEEFNDYKLDDYCPNCGTAYDDIDYEYQICHYCKHNNNNTTQKPETQTSKQ